MNSMLPKHIKAAMSMLQQTKQRSREESLALTYLMKANVQLDMKIKKDEKKKKVDEHK